MIPRPAAVILMALVGLVWTGGAWAGTQPGTDRPRDRQGYADYLLREGDTFRAISVYKELLYFSSDPEVRQGLLIQLGHAYRYSGRPASAIFYYDNVLRQESAAPLNRKRARLGLAISYIQMRTLPLAEQSLGEAGSAGDRDLCAPRALTTALIRAESGSHGEAASILEGLSTGACPDTHPLSPKLDAWTTRLKAGPRGKKSPVLAGVLSAVIPGAGQVYSGHLFDAAQSFGFVTTFALATWAAYLHERDTGGSYVLTGTLGAITGIFHGANIAGAVRTAGYANYRARENLVGGLRATVLKLDF